jgi:hypothetical protein
MPLFIFVTAISDVKKIKPLGPPTDFTDDNRDVIRGELADMVRFYTRKTTVTFEETMKTIEVEKKWSAKLTDEAWLRYNALEAQMLTAGMESQRPDIMTPTYSRLAVSILKAATLLAAARMDSEDVVVIEKKDIIRAAVYGQQWRDFGLEVMNNVGLGAAERQLEQILRLIERKPGCTRSHIMQYYHINARDMEGMLMTLQQRSQITRQRAGKTEQLYPLLPVGRNL